MKRGTKLFLYGLMYLSLFGLIGFVSIYPQIQKTNAPTCFDGIQNQDEEGIDCGGPCISCELKNLEPIISQPQALQVSNSRYTLVARVSNPSVNYGAQAVEYSFEVVDSFGQAIGSFGGTTSLLPGEDKYIAEVGINLPGRDISGVRLILEEIDFKQRSDLPEYSFDIGAVETSFPPELVVISGLLTNNSGSTLRTVVLTTLLYTPEDILVNAGKTIISDIGPFASRDFLISLPRGDVFIDPSKTRVFFEVGAVTI